MKKIMVALFAMTLLIPTTASAQTMTMERIAKTSPVMISNGGGISVGSVPTR